MAEAGSLKAQGLAFGRALQTAFKIAAIYSAEHPLAEKSFQQAFTTLTSLLKDFDQFTFGFLNRRVVLNNILTDDDSLSRLEIELSERSIGGVSFALETSYRDFKRAVACLCTKPAAIEEKGGIRAFLEGNPIKGVRILVAEKSKDKTGDTVMRMDMESYLTAQAILGHPSGTASSGVDFPYQSAGMQQAPSFPENSQDLLKFADQTTRAVLAAPDGDVSQILKVLTRLLEQLKPESLMSSLSPSGRNELQGSSAHEVAVDLVENGIVHWATDRFEAARSRSEIAAVEEEVLRALLRGVKATRVAERILEKLARFMEEAHLPGEVYERIREGLKWLLLSDDERHSRLVSTKHFSEQDFSRLVSYVHEAMQKGGTEKAVEVSRHYLSLLGSRATPERTLELPKVSMLLPHVISSRTLDFACEIANQFCQELAQNSDPTSEYHREIANCLGVVTRSLARYEQFELVLKVGMALEGTRLQDRVRHAQCCGKALAHLVHHAGLERLVDLYLEKRAESAWARVIIAILRLTGSAGPEVGFSRLEEELAAANRLQLIRLITRLGSAAIEVVRKRLQDGRWYVVRNACYILGELGDPELPEALGPALRHNDTRVQQAAITALVKGHAADHAPALADALLNLQGPPLEMALDELFFLKDPESVRGIKRFILEKAQDRVASIRRAVDIFAIIHTDEAVEALETVLAEANQEPTIRKAALSALARSPSARARLILREFVRTRPGDRISIDVRKALGLPT